MTEVLENHFNEIVLDEEYDKEDGYKYTQRIGDDIVRRNNDDETLTPDGLPTVEKQLELLEKVDFKVERIIHADNLIKLKCYIMYKLNYHILMDFRLLKPSKKSEYIKIRDDYIIDLVQGKLDEDFNKACRETIFECGEDMSQLPVYF